jgi:alpha-glucosidase (family GH31 glycosyl hydrolase)
MYMRWVQFGVFSPIIRLHSTAKEFLGKEPWKYREEVFRCACEWLRFRHKLIPYLFTMDRKTHSEGIGLCEPMYYSYPEEKDAYTVPNQYTFGSELIVCPITAPQNKELNLGSVEVWLPEGRYTDIFTGRSYTGNRKITMFRELETIPVLAKDGAIIPLSADKGNLTDNPENLEIWAVSGDGSFTLVEDNGKTDCEEHTALTKLEIAYDGGELTFTVNGTVGDLSVIPQKRNYTVKVLDLEKDGEPVVLEFSGADVTQTAVLTAKDVRRKQPYELREEVIAMISRWQATTMAKSAAFIPFEKAQTAEQFDRALRASILPKPVALALRELLETDRQ